ncbi:hypothetical protein NDU88_004972 [Pleurodeles waltl]|uniref:Uncharacterized protein n=1 Tax=Pleurodeles waltl TaxID=8319 RepID=A0AAV7UGV5_PLEWA|nr:hypothetical protein NDU88_004972 [Pleurodeles waltl]
MSDRQHSDAAYLQEQEDLFLAEDIVDALDASVAQSVNRALAVALQPIARQLKRYALTVPPYGQSNPMPLLTRADEKSPPQTEWPQAAPMARIAQAPATDHEY